MLLDHLAERYRLLVRAHADSTAFLVLAGLGTLVLPVFIPFAVARIVIANRRAGVVANQYLTTARYVARLAPLPLPVVVPDDAERITKAVTTAADLGRGSVERLARSEPLQAGQRALSAAMATTKLGWTRHAGEGACRICMNLADGLVVPADVAMIVPHPSCSCTQRLVLEATS